jgi:hypothetical protein
MALPAKGFTKAQCGDVYDLREWQETTGYVRDRSERKTPFEVSPGIQELACREFLQRHLSADADPKRLMLTPAVNLRSVMGKLVQEPRVTSPKTPSM